VSYKYYIASFFATTAFDLWPRSTS